jgi:hypothetical protein
MSRSIRRSPSLLSTLGTLGAVVWLSHAAPAQAEPHYPVTAAQRGTAQQVAEAGVPLSELAPNAPDSYTVKRHDTLWGISKIFLKSPWRWPELWGMNLNQIRNPHLIYPGQLLVLDKSSGRAVLRFGQPVAGGGDLKLEPRVRDSALDGSAITSVPMNLIGPFLTEAVVFDDDVLESAPRIVATQEGRVLLSRGETAYVRGDVSSARAWQVFRQPVPLTDPTTGEVLGYEARHVGSAEVERAGGTGADGQLVASTFKITALREEANVGDRLTPMPAQDFEAFAPHPPAQPLKAQVISVYGDGLYAGQNQVVSINRGTRDGMERGNVLALWRTGKAVTDGTSADRALMTLPDEHIGSLFIFRVFQRVSYGLILESTTTVGRGDTVTQP